MISLKWVTKTKRTNGDNGKETEVWRERKKGIPGKEIGGKSGKETSGTSARNNA